MPDNVVNIAAGGWIEFQLGGPVEALEVFADYMDDLGAGGAIFSENPDGGGQMVTVFLPGKAGDDAVARARARAAALREDFPGDWRELKITRVEDRDWNEEWKNSLEPIRLEPGLWIVPTFKEPPPEAKGEPMLRLDPGMAFGTGRHPTTAGAVRFIAETIRAGARSMLDLGCGTGILAMAAAKFGAERLLGLDIDSLALKVAEANLRLNGLENLVRLGQGVSDPSQKLDEPPFDLVAANVFAEALARLMPFIERNLAPGGSAVLSGILIDREPIVLEALAKNGLAVSGRFVEEGWVTLKAKRKSA